MENIDRLLNPIEDEQHRCKILSFIQRMNIAIDVAYEVEYLNLHCEILIVHCDVKPSNVLLNEDIFSHLLLYLPQDAKFGIALQ
jgi:serine/threonine protein kinase